MHHLDTAVVLAGGLGTRLRPLTNRVPKPLIPVQGRPILEHVLDILKRSDITNVYLSVGYLWERIRDHFGDGAEFGVRIEYIVEQGCSGTGGWLHLVSPSQLGDCFVVLNGDNLMDIDFAEVFAFHQRVSPAVTIVAKPVMAEAYAGAEILSVGPDGRVLDYVDRGRAALFLDTREEVLVSSGYYIFAKEAFQMAPMKLPLSNEKDLFPIAAGRGRLAAYVSRALWFDTGTFERLAEVERSWSLSARKPSRSDT